MSINDRYPLKCPICGKGIPVRQGLECSECLRVVCSDCTHTDDGVVYCHECIADHSEVPAPSYNGEVICDYCGEIIPAGGHHSECRKAWNND